MEVGDDDPGVVAALATDDLGATEGIDCRRRASSARLRSIQRASNST
jgi:hypothetical protein